MPQNAVDGGTHLISPQLIVPVIKGRDCRGAESQEASCSVTVQIATKVVGSRKQPERLLEKV